jgi:hypothetical protein
MALVNGWSATQTLGIVAFMVGSVLAVIYRRPLADAIANLNYGGAFPPIPLPREERPERIAQARDSHARAARFIEVGIIVSAVMIWTFGPLALIDGREGPIFDALL